MTSIHYRQGLSRAGSHGAPGAWLAAACESKLLLVALPPAAEVEARAQALWSSINSARGIQAVLDELTRGGVSATPPFALVEWDVELGSVPASVRAIIRGEVSLVVRTVDGSTSADASGVSTWLERKYSQVLGFDIEVSDAAGSGAAAGASSAVPTPALPLVTGMAWVSTVTVGADGASAGTETDSPASKPAASKSATSKSAPGESAAGEPPVSELTVSEQTVTELTVSAEPAPAAPAAAEAESSYDYLFGETVFRTVSDAAVRDEDGTASDPAGSAAATPAEPGTGEPEAGKTDDADAGDHDGHTIASSDIAKLRAARKARASSAAPAVVVPPAPILSLELSNGTRESLAQPILVGRAPSVSKVSSGQIPRLLTISGPEQDISRNHVQFAVEGGTVVVTDLHSRNGTVVILPGRQPQQLRQGEPTSVIVGTVVDLGGGVTFTVCED
jgi:hypothetical protein